MYSDTPIDQWFFEMYSHTHTNRSMVLSDVLTHTNTHTYTQRQRQSPQLPLSGHAAWLQEPGFPVRYAGSLGPC